MLQALLSSLPARPETPDPLGQRAARPGLLRDLARDILQAAMDRPSHADLALRDRFRQDRRLGSHDRALLKDGIYTVLRRHALQSLLLREGGWTGERQPEALWLAWLVWERGVPASVAAGSFSAPIFDLLERPLEALRDWVERERPSPSALLALVGALPEWLVSAWINDRGLDGALALTCGMAGRAPLGLRVNRLKASREQAQQALAQEGISSAPGRWCPNALIVEGSANVVGTRAFASGLVEVQDEGSQLIAALVVPPRRSLVVDLCAGAGGKTLALAAELPAGSEILGFDVRSEALQQAQRRVERAGVSDRVRLMRLDPGKPLPLKAGSAARVLVDAPCSGTGTLRRTPGLRWRLNEAELYERPRAQREILERALPLLRPGGRLIYATCSVMRAENEAVVEALLQDHPTLQLIPALSVLGATRRELCSGPYLSLNPQEHGTDGFFAAVLQR